jgi:plasmanylethanolamine desaturase
MLGYLCARIALSVQGPDWWMVGLCVAVGFLAADFVSGLVHWAGDTIGDTETPLVGKHFIKPFREHHVDAKAITRHDFVETNGNNCIASLPLLGAVAPILPDQPGVGFYGCSIVVFTSGFLFLANQFHKWAHADRPPPFARFLQRWHLILPPTHHNVHHASPHDKYYCITVGWLNPVLSWTRFFRVLEWAIALVRPKLLHLAERSSTVRAAHTPTLPG